MTQLSLIFQVEVDFWNPIKFCTGFRGNLFENKGQNGFVACTDVFFFVVCMIVGIKNEGNQYSF